MIRKSLLFLSYEFENRGKGIRHPGGRDFSILSDEPFTAYLCSADTGIKNVRSRTSKLFTSSLRSTQYKKNYV